MSTRNLCIVMFLCTLALVLLEGCGNTPAPAPSPSASASPAPNPNEEVTLGCNTCQMQYKGPRSGVQTWYDRHLAAHDSYEVFKRMEILRIQAEAATKTAAKKKE